MRNGGSNREQQGDWQRERGKDRNRKMTGWSAGFSSVFSASPCHREIIPCWAVSLSSVGASVRVHRLGKHKSLRGFIWLGCRGGHRGRWRWERDSWATLYPEWELFTLPRRVGAAAPPRLTVNGGLRGRFSQLTASWGPNWCPAVPAACCTVIPGGVISGCPEPWRTF